MKRIISVLVILVIFIGVFSACAKNTAPAPSGTSAETERKVTAQGLRKAADGFPSKPITLLTDSAAGTEAYTINQTFAKIAKKYAEIDFHVEGYEGGSGVMALNELIKKGGDGYTIFQQSLTLPLTIGFGQAPYKVEDVQPIAGMFGDSMVITVLPDSPYKSMKEIVDYAKANPGKFNWGGAKTKAAIHAFSGMLWKDAGIKVNYIAYPSGTDAIVAVLGGNTMCNASSLSGVLDYYKNGKLKILAISTPQRHPELPDVPTFKELGYDAVTGYSIYRGWYAKAGVSKEYIEVLEQLCQLVYNDPEWKNFMKTLGKEESWKNNTEFTKWYKDIASSTENLGF